MLNLFSGSSGKTIFSVIDLNSNLSISDVGGSPMIVIASGKSDWILIMKKFSSQALLTGTVLAAPMSKRAMKSNPQIS